MILSAAMVSNLVGISSIKMTALRSTAYHARYFIMIAMNSHIMIVQYGTVFGLLNTKVPTTWVNLPKARKSLPSHPLRNRRAADWETKSFNAFKALMLEKATLKATFMIQANLVSVSIEHKRAKTNKNIYARISLILARHSPCLTGAFSLLRKGRCVASSQPVTTITSADAQCEPAHKLEFCITIH